MEQKKKYAPPQMNIVDFKHRTCLLGGSPDSIPVYMCDDDDCSSNEQP